MPLAKINGATKNQNRTAIMSKENCQEIACIPNKSEMITKQKVAYSHAAFFASGAIMRLHSQAATTRAIKKKAPR